jgi:glycosyltransferase involved in cell wall biosynthesis
MVHNAYGTYSGEEAVVDGVRRLLEAHGHRLTTLARSSEEIPRMALGKVRAFWRGIYSPASRRQMRDLLRAERPDVVHVHNVFPLISPSILPECRAQGVPVVMTVHNFRLVCPNGLFMTRGRPCEKCSGGREYWCVLRNCEGSLLKSLGYAARNAVARRRRLFLDNVTAYAALTEFQRGRLIREGFPADRIHVIPNMSDPAAVEPAPDLGATVGCVGRVSPEKGVSTLMEAAALCPDTAFAAAGATDRMPDLAARAPKNFTFVGHLDRRGLADFYRACRVVVVPSLCYESFPLVLAEAALHGRPVICSRIGGLPEIVEDGVTGLLFEPGDAADLAAKIRVLCDRPDLARSMGRAAREKALREYSPDKYYDRLMDVYERAIEAGPGGPAKNEK